MTHQNTPLDFATPRQPRSVMDHFRLYVPMALTGAALVALSITAANAGPVLRSYNVIQVQPGAAPGIERSPSAAPWYRPAGERSYATINPPADVIHIGQPAPRNRCGPGRFEVVNPGPGEGRCFGH